MTGSRTVYWLTPIMNRNPLTLGRERICLPSAAAFDSFRSCMTALHPRLLPLFKAHLLPGDDHDEMCGSEQPIEEVLDMANNEDLVFDGTQLRLSHCALAFANRLLEPEAALGLLPSIQALDNWQPPHTEWLACMRSWLEQGFPVFIVKEE